jgi:preprotein translocase subunit YajC
MTAAAFTYATSAFAAAATLLGATAASAQTAAPAGAPGGAAAGPLDAILTSPLPLLVVFGALFYFMILRPQTQRAKQHQATISAIKRNDTVVLSNGMIGKVSKVEDKELGVEIATGVVVKVVRSMVQEVRSKSEPSAANDTKA